MKSSLFLKVLWCAGAALIAAGIGVAYAASQSSPVTYPVQALGGCTNESDCKAYCDKQENMLPCVAFAETHGLISSEEAAKAKEFADILKGGGPGGCNSKDSCEAYCDDTGHIDECSSFAEKHNLRSPQELDEAKKVAKALREGKSLPGGCKNKQSCDAYCQNSDHIDECLSFAESAGLIDPREAEEAHKVMGFIKRGETPGKCVTKEQCDAYCKDDGHINECVTFAERAGFMTKEEADMARKTGGKGPGGCNSKDSCDAFCNKQENQETCFAFAKEHGLIPEEKLKEMKENMGRLRAGLEQAPPEVADCLKNGLGSDIVEKIQDGTFTPGPQSGERIRTCFEQFMPKMKEVISRMPEEVRTCIENKIGTDRFEKIQQGEAPTPEMGDEMRSCAEGARKQMPTKEQILERIPEQARECVASKIGEKNPEEMGPAIRSVIENCMGEFQKQMMPQSDRQFQNQRQEMEHAGETSGRFENGERETQNRMEQLPMNQGNPLRPANPPQSSSGASVGQPMMNQEAPIAPVPQQETNPVQ